jgi:hypothetical protein
MTFVTRSILANRSRSAMVLAGLVTNTVAPSILCSWKPRDKWGNKIAEGNVVAGLIVDEQKRA